MFDDEAATIIKQLTGKDVDVNEKAYDDRTAIIGAAIAGNVSTIEALLKAGVDPNNQQNQGQTFVVTDTLESYSRAEAKKEIEALGGKVRHPPINLLLTSRRF